MTLREFSGNAKRTTLLSDITSASTQFTVADASGYPTGTTAPFVVVLSPGITAEEKVLVTSRNANTFQVAERGYDGTTPSAHLIGTGVDHVLDATTVREMNAHLDATTAHGVTFSALATTAALAGKLDITTAATTYARRSRVIVGPTGDYTTLSAALAAFPGGNVDISLLSGDHTVSAPLTPTTVKNVRISGAGRNATRLLCAGNFITARTDCDAWVIQDLAVVCTTATNTLDGVDVDYPRRWSIRNCHFEGFGGSSVRLRGGIQCEVDFNFFLAKDSSNTNGFAGLHIERSLASVVSTTMRTRGNYVGSGKQYGYYIDRSNVGSVFEADIAELCDVGFRFEVASGELRSPYTEANRVAGVQLHDSAMVVTGRVRDEPVVTWANVAAADRVITRLDRYYVNPGKAVIYGGSTGGSNPDTSPSIRWGTGTPEGVRTAVVGSVFFRTDGGALTTMYVKETGTGNTGWVAK